jgi:hypothetical protein
MTHNCARRSFLFCQNSFHFNFCFYENRHEGSHVIKVTFLLYVEPQRSSGLCRPIVEVSRSHTIRHTNIR